MYTNWMAFINPTINSMRSNWPRCFFFFFSNDKNMKAKSLPKANKFISVNTNTKLQKRTPFSIKNQAHNQTPYGLSTTHTHFFPLTLCVWFNSKIMIIIIIVWRKLGGRLESLLLHEEASPRPHAFVLRKAFLPCQLYLYPRKFIRNSIHAGLLPCPLSLLSKFTTATKFHILESFVLENKLEEFFKALEKWTSKFMNVLCILISICFCNGEVGSFFSFKRNYMSGKI